MKATSLLRGCHKWLAHLDSIHSARFLRLLKLKMPAVFGPIAAGVAIGPSAFGWLRIGTPLELLSELGAILLLLSVGLETKLHDLRKAGSVALHVGVFSR